MLTHLTPSALHKTIDIDRLEGIAREAKAMCRPFREGEVSPEAVLALVERLREKEAEETEERLAQRLRAQELAFRILRTL